MNCEDTGNYSPVDKILREIWKIVIILSWRRLHYFIMHENKL